MTLAREDAVGTVTSEHEQPDSWSGPLGGPPAIQATASETLEIAKPEPAELGFVQLVSPGYTCADVWCQACS